MMQTALRSLSHSVPKQSSLLFSSLPSRHFATLPHGLKNCKQFATLPYACSILGGKSFSTPNSVFYKHSILPCNKSFDTLITRRFQTSGKITSMRSLVESFAMLLRYPQSLRHLLLNP